MGTRRAIPFSLPFSRGNTNDTALAAPVEVGKMFRAAARALLKSRWEASSSLWSPVYEWVVVMVPLMMPNFLSSTFTKARQLVVHEALLMILSSCLVVGVHSYHVSGDSSLPRRGDEHLLGSGLQVLAGTSLVAEHPGALDDKVDVQVPA